MCTTGDIPSFKLFESDKILAFLDINPLSSGHAVCFLPPNRNKMMWKEKMEERKGNGKLMVQIAGDSKIPRREIDGYS
jgi:diadenosine tetraphosphate (Ap4A) HIT family hydrolase